LKRIYVKAVANDGPHAQEVESPPLEIQVQVWNPPTISAFPPSAATPANPGEITLPDKVSWLNGRYVGVVRQPIKFQAAGAAQNSDPAEQLNFVWDFNNDGTFEIGQSTGFYSFPSTLIPQNLDTVANYIQNNNVPPSVIGTFSTISFPNTTGSFSHSNGFNTGLTDFFFARFTGMLVIATPGVYQFHIASDDAFRFKVDGTTVAEFPDPRAFLETTGSRTFDQAGVYPFELTFVEWGGSAGLTLNWTPPSSPKTITPIQNRTLNIWNAPNLNATVLAKAVTNFGIESSEQRFDLRVYDALQADAGGPYSGRSGQAIRLNGAINAMAYPGATIVYTWSRIEGNTAVPIPNGASATAEFTWMTDGTYEVQLSTTVTTSEGLVLVDTERTTVRVESGLPTAMPGGPYRGGIFGGNFSPIQFIGNPPDFLEAADVGLIQNWLWFIEDPHANLNNYALNFDGVDDAVENITTTEFPTGANAVSVFAWIQTTASVPQTVFSYGGVGTGEAVNLTLNAAGQFVVDFNQNAVNSRRVVNDGAWHHIGFSYPGVGTAITLYVDAEAITQFDMPLSAAPNISSNTTAQIGHDIAASNRFRGHIDDVSVWRRALNDAEVLSLILPRTLNPDLPPSSLVPASVAYWAFNEGSGDVLSDGSIFDNDAMLTGVGPQWVRSGVPIVIDGIWNPTYAYLAAGKYALALRVQAETGKWSPRRAAPVTVLDGAIRGTVRAADLRTPVRDVRLRLTSSHVDPDVLAMIATSAGVETGIDSETGERFIVAETDDVGNYAFEHIPLGSYRLVASKIEGGTIHEFEVPVQAVEITLDAPIRLAVDFVDLSVFPIGGRIVYSIQKNGEDVLVDGVTVTAQPLGNASLIEAVPSTSSLTNDKNYSMPLFAGRYLFLAQRSGHDIRRVGTSPGDPRTPPAGYDADVGGLMTIQSARNDIDFIDHTTRQLRVTVVDSGDFPYPGKTITVSGTNGQADQTDSTDETGADTNGIFVFTLNPGAYTVTIPGALTDDGDETEEVDLTGGDQTITMTIPVPIVLTISPEPRLFGNATDFPEGSPERELIETFNLTNQNPEGFMVYYPPEPRAHTYTVMATANGNPVGDFTLIVTDDVSQFTADPAAEQEVFIQGDAGDYTLTAGLPAVDRTVHPPIAAPKTVTFRARKDRYLDSELVVKMVTVLGDVPVGTAARIVSIPIVNYTVLHDPPGDGSYSSLDDSLTIKGVVSGMKIQANVGIEIPVYPSPWSVERSIDNVQFKEEQEGDITTLANAGPDLEDRGLIGSRSLGDGNTAGTAFSLFALIEATTGPLIVATGSLGYFLQIVKVGIVVGSLSAGAEILQYEISPNRKLQTPSGGYSDRPPGSWQRRYLLWRGVDARFADQIPAGNSIQ